MPIHLRGRRLVAILAAILLTLFTSGVAFAHEERAVGAYQIVVGFMNEPVFVGDRSGLEFFVSQNDQPVEGLESTIKAEVIQGTERRDLPVSRRFGEAGAYQSYFFPTVAGKYTFHVTGTLPDGSAIDESFTSSEEGFGEVEEAASGQFPMQFPPISEVAAQARRGSDAAGQVPLALGLGGAGIVIGLAALGLVLAGRSRAR